MNNEVLIQEARELVGKIGFLANIKSHDSFESGVDLAVAYLRAAEARGIKRASVFCGRKASDIRDNGPKGKEGLLTAWAGAHMGAWFNASWALDALARAETEGGDAV